MLFVRVGLRALVGVGLLFGLWLGWQAGPSVLAALQYERVVEQEPQTRRELEASLWYTGHQAITKAQSHGGRYTHVDGDFERYTVLGAPIDVVYAGDRVVSILSSFE
jgi:hypothetical protein